MKEWFARAEIAAAACGTLPSDPGALSRHIEQAGWHDDPRRFRARNGRGGGFEYHLSLLPADVQARLLARHHLAAVGEAMDPQEARSAQLWKRFDGLPAAAKAKARERLAAVQRIDTLCRGGMTRQLAVALTAKETSASTSTLWNWLRLAEAVPPSDRLPALAPRHRGRTATATCDPRAWAFLVADYLRPERPNFEACYRRLTEAAAEHGWTPMPSAKTLKRRIERDVPAPARQLARQGREAAARSYPHQRRDRSIFAAMEAVNADGHRFDVFVRWPDGTVGRPMMVAFQDLYSGKVVSHRLDRSENWTAVRLALADMVESFGVPEQCWLDNGRSFASKWLTGGMATRYRFKVRDDEPSGILTELGVTVHWTTPYHGQAKPIERAFRDLCEEIARHPKCAGAYTGNAPQAKPENYGSKAIAIDDFRALVATEIGRHNRRQGRRTATARGGSFDDAFRTSLEAPTTLIRRATAEQRRMFLSAAEGVTARKPTGEITLGDNRYWAEPLAGLIGERLTVRFDPQDLFQPVSVYAADGRFVAEAECIAATGFADIDAAREHARAKRLYLKRMREALNLERRLSIDEVAALMPSIEPDAPPRPQVVRLIANGAAREAGAAADAERFSRGLTRIFGAEGAVLPFRKEDGGRG